MNSKRQLYSIPVASTDFTREAFLDCSGINPTIRYGYRAEQGEILSGVEFRVVAAFRYRNEGCCSAWHIEDAYDALVEVAPSAWLEEVGKDVPEHFKADWHPRHFMIYLDSVGCFEFLAEAWEAAPEVLITK